MKGRYRGTNETLCKAIVSVGAVVIPVSMILFFSKRFDLGELFPAVFGIFLIGVLLAGNFPCGFNSDETGFTMSVIGFFRKRYFYDDLESVSVSHYVKTIRTQGGGEIYRTIVNFTVKDRNGNTKTYTEMSSIDMSRPYAAGSFDKLPQLIKLCGYIQEQMGFHTEAENTLRPPKVMTSGGGSFADYPALEKPQPRRAAAVQTQSDQSSRTVGYYMGFSKRAADTYQILAALILPVNFFMWLLDYTIGRYITVGGMIAAIILLMRLSVNPPCKFTADEDGFAITTGKHIHKYEYGEIEKASCKVHSRLLNKSFIVLTLKKRQGGKVCYYESSRSSNRQIINDPSAGVPELIRLGNIIEQAIAARGIWSRNGILDFLEN